MMASYYGHHKCVKLLVQAGAEVNYSDIYGSTAIMRAVLHGHKEVILDLLQADADLTAKGKDGKTVADHTNDNEIKNLLRKWGQKRRAGSRALRHEEEQKEQELAEQREEARLKREIEAKEKEKEKEREKEKEKEEERQITQLVDAMHLALSGSDLPNIPYARLSIWTGTNEYKYTLICTSIS